MYRATRIYLVFFLLVLASFIYVAASEAAAGHIVPHEEKVEIEAIGEIEAAETRQEIATDILSKQEVEIEKLNLPEDTTVRFTISELHISGNTLIPTDELLNNLPKIYNASDKPIQQAEQGELYDLRPLHKVVLHPGEPIEVSRRVLQGFTQYILSVYQDHGYAGIYVYIAAQTVQGSVRLQDGVLPVEIVEAEISEINITSYNTERERVEQGILRSSVIEDWSPVKVGQVVKKRELDYFVNLLNLNPDRHVSAVISRSSEPNTLALGYDVYEADPWHYYIQVDNSGTEERQWAPRLGLSNTNLTGIDDQLIGLFQAPWESGIEDNYLLFGSYEFPVFTPRLHFNVYGGQSKFDTTPEGGPLNFLGRGSFHGGMLRFNVFEINGWFLDITNSLSYEKSEVTPILFKTLESDVEMDLWIAGVGLHRSNDISNASFRFNQVQSVDGSTRSRFNKARPGADPDFTIYSASAAYSQYLESDKVQRFSSSFRWITTDERLAPSKMTTFGGLYSVRGYEEDEIVADKGTLMSFQYEFDLVQHSKPGDGDSNESNKEQNNGLELSKLAPLAFFDFGRAKIVDAVTGEKSTQELCSIGTGLLIDVGNDFSAGIYYGWPLRSTLRTDEGSGRFGFSFIKRF
ncbi:MAG: ShlB/FhaC/HecB family hemolysin secretion/activation protein [Planctomycetes bacterium]|nr:ShlB/FhaC/HecB family hemolysin secretion/activation protein [Planctomycetota bacterium]